MNKIYKVMGQRGRITIPLEIRLRLGFVPNDIVSFRAEGSTVAVKREKLCSDCRHTRQATDEDTITLLELLDSLSTTEQRAALLHLSVKWAENQSGEKHG